MSIPPVSANAIPSPTLLHESMILMRLSRSLMKDWYPKTRLMLLYVQKHGDGEENNILGERMLHTK